MYVNKKYEKLLMFQIVLVTLFKELRSSLKWEEEETSYIHFKYNI